MGTLVPPWYREEPTSQGGLLVAAFFFGSSTAVAMFDFTNAVRHTHRSWRRSRRAMTYVVMLWAVIATCIVTSLCSWLFLLGIIPPSIWYFLGIIFTWTIEVQCLMQILANRLSLIMYNPQKERLLKVGLLVAIGIVNLSVFCIWIPARLQISPTFIRINNIWDRTEKAIFAAIDMSMNVYFMRLVRSKLVASGLKRYDIVWKYNALMVFISISLDVLVIGLMSLPDDAVYVQVHPLTFLAKLNIEMSMADMLGKVAKQSSKRIASLAAPDIWQPYLGTEPDVFDREWLGSAKDLAMPSDGGGAGCFCGKGTEEDL
ncbi:hypothetical protein VTH06DRAFT_161 [Thermothelomyces fergusii]